MLFHLKTVVLILVVMSGVGVTVNALRTTTKIEPSKFESKRKIAKDAALADGPVAPDAKGSVAVKSQPVDPNIAVLADVMKYFGNPDVYFVDARKPEQYAAGHIKGSINLPSTALFENIERVVSYVPQPNLVIVYCDGGNCEASHTVADALRNQFGYTNVKVYVKGWEELITSPKFAELTETGP